MGFYFNSLVDSGEILDLKETHQKLREGKLFEWLLSKYSEQLDISLYTSEELNDMEKFFQGLSETTDESRKMGIVNNGLCLLVAYCLDGAQIREEFTK